MMSTSDPEPDPDSFSPTEVKQAWRLVTWAGLLGSLYYLLCIFGAPRIKFLTELGATAFHFGLISGLGAFAIAFQVLGGILSNRLTRRKPLWMFLAIAHRIVFIGVLVAPPLFTGKPYLMAWIILFLVLHDVLAQMTIPMWLTWMADLIPKETMTRHWATRQRFITAVNILAMVLLAFGFHYFEITNRIILGFTILSIVGIVLGILDIVLFYWVPEPPNERLDRVPLREVLIQPLRDPEFRPFLYFMAFFHFAIFMAAPFFGLYMIDFLQLNVLTVQLLGTASALGVVLSSRFWGLLCDTYGYRPALQVLSFGKAFTPLAFLLAPLNPSICIPYLVVFMFLDGILNAGVGLAIQGVQLKHTPRRNRTAYIAAVNFLSIGIMAGIAPVIAGRLIDFMNLRVRWDVGPYQFTGYHGVFLVSVLMRLGASGYASRLVEKKDIPVRVVLKEFRSLKAWRVTRLAYQLHEAKEESRRLEAAQTLGELRNPMAIEELIAALDDSSTSVRKASAEALGQIGMAEATEPLTRALLNPSSGIQSPAARALGLIGGTESLRALLTNLKNLDSESLIDTIDSLAAIGDSDAIVPLICLFHEVDDNETIHRHIASTLSSLSATESVEEVLELLRGRRSIQQRPLR